MIFVFVFVFIIIDIIIIIMNRSTIETLYIIDNFNPNNEFINLIQLISYELNGTIEKTQLHHNYGFSIIWTGVGFLIIEYECSANSAVIISHTLFSFKHEVNDYLNLTIDPFPLEIEASGPIEEY